MTSNENNDNIKTVINVANPFIHVDIVLLILKIITAITFMFYTYVFFKEGRKNFIYSKSTDRIRSIFKTSKHFDDFYIENLQDYDFKERFKIRLAEVLFYGCLYCSYLILVYIFLEKYTYNFLDKICKNLFITDYSNNVVYNNHINMFFLFIFLFSSIFGISVIVLFLLGLAHHYSKSSPNNKKLILLTLVLPIIFSLLYVICIFLLIKYYLPNRVNFFIWSFVNLGYYFLLIFLIVDIIEAFYSWFAKKIKLRNLKDFDFNVLNEKTIDLLKEYSMINYVKYKDVNRELIDVKIKTNKSQQYIIVSGKIDKCELGIVDALIIQKLGSCVNHYYLRKIIRNFLVMLYNLFICFVLFYIIQKYLPDNQDLAVLYTLMGFFFYRIITQLYYNIIYTYFEQQKVFKADAFAKKYGYGQDLIKAHAFIAKSEGTPVMDSRLYSLIHESKPSFITRAHKLLE